MFKVKNFKNIHLVKDSEKLNVNIALPEMKSNVKITRAKLKLIVNTFKDENHEEISVGYSSIKGGIKQDGWDNKQI